MTIKGIITMALFLFSQLAIATNVDQYELSISNHRFEPAELTIPANTKVTLLVHNQDDGPEEFHSDSLHREKIISPHATGLINIGPLPPGVYEFMGEFHAETAQGRIIIQ